MSYISEPVIYRSMLIESPLEVYGNNCIVEGANLTYDLDENKIFQVTITPSIFVISNRLIKLSESYTVDLDCSIYNFDDSKLVLLGHFVMCSNNSCTNFLYRLAILSDKTHSLYPSVLDSNNNDIVNNPSILLGAFDVIRNENGEIISIENLTPDRKKALSYVTNPSYLVTPTKNLELMPFDRVTDRVAELIVFNTGGTGAQGIPGPQGIRGKIG